MIYKFVIKLSIIVGFFYIKRNVWSYIQFLFVSNNN